MDRALTILAYTLLGVAGIAFVALMAVFPTVGTANGTHTLYAMRRPIAVSAGEYRLVMGLFATACAASPGGLLCLLLKTRSTARP